MCRNTIIVLSGKFQRDYDYLVIITSPFMKLPTNRPLLKLRPFSYFCPFKAETLHFADTGPIFVSYDSSQKPQSDDD
jgi:hypothetical protein